jgi:hypothetical protein
MVRNGRGDVSESEHVITKCCNHLTEKRARQSPLPPFDCSAGGRALVSPEVLYMGLERVVRPVAKTVSRPTQTSSTSRNGFGKVQKVGQLCRLDPNWACQFT